MTLPGLTDINKKEATTKQQMVVDENNNFIHLSCNENLYSLAHRHNGIDPLRNREYSCRYFCKESLSKASKAKR